MVFNSLLFVFVFFPITALGLALLGRRGGSTAALAFLLGASLVFTASSGGASVGVLLFSLTLNYAVARAMGAATAEGRRAWLWLGVAGNLILLGGFKVARWLPTYAHHAPPLAPESTGWLFPVGLSFYTLCQIGYLVDAYASGGVERNPVRYALFVAGFPHVSAGPILRYKDIRSQFSSPLLGRITAEHLAQGLTLVAIGLFKKTVLAAGMERFATPVFDAASLGSSIAWWEAVVGSTAYSFQLYFDFSGYSDIAVGLACVCGLMLPSNFDSPYAAVNIVDFWNRWHISLSRWLQTFVFTPLALSLSRAAGPSTILGVSALSWAYAGATLLTMLVCGVWHGMGLTFVVWGLLHGVFLLIHRLWRGRDIPAVRGSAWVCRGTTFAAVTLAWVVFRAPTLTAASNLWWAMFGGHGAVVSGGGVLTAFTPWTIAGWMAAVAFIVWGLPSTRAWMAEPGAVGARPPGLAGALGLASWRPELRVALAVSAMLVCAILSLQGKSEFIYLNF